LKKAGWDAFDVVFGTGYRIFIHVYFNYFSPSGIVTGKTIQQGGHGFAGATPGGPAIHHHNTFMPKYGRVKLTVVDVHGKPGNIGKGCPALCAHWFLLCLGTGEFCFWYRSLYMQ